MDDSMEVSAFEVESSDFEPEKPKAKAKAPAKKAAAAPKPKAPKQTKLTKAPTTSKAAPKPKKRAKPESDKENSDVDDASENDDSLLSNTPPSSKKQKKAPAPKKSSGKPLAEVENESFAMDVPVAQSGSKKGGSTEQYQKLTQLEHILKRPDTYIGSVERTTEQLWVFNSETETMENRKVSFVPGLYKIFDEILVNAADNKQRDKNMNELRVWVDAEKGIIAVQNNGKGIPVEIHGKEGIYIPEMIFGHLLTSSNYDDEEAKVTGGRNGYGAKLTNIYSTQFDLDTVDSKTKQRYRQTWRKNMSVMDKAKIDKSKDSDYTKITFKPDFSKFGMDKMDDDFEALVKRRVYDMAGTCKGVKVYLNQQRIKITKFKQYMEMYTKAIKTENLANDGTAPEQVILTDNPHERWEIGFAVSDGSFQQVSFVNSISTTSGGTHVNYIADQIIDKLEDIVNKKNKGGVKLKKAQIKNHIFLFVNALIVNPAFTSQTKEQLTTKVSAFGSKPQVSETFLKAIAKTEAVTNIIHFAQQKADKVLAKSDGNRRQRMNNSKLTDANKAGTKDGYKCTLILTEGDSAALLALAGRAVVNPDLFGVFPLRGKILNVRDASIDQISKNQEIQNIKKFLGLQHKKEYTDTRGLRYGHLMIMTDQDHDGSHIKGLLINFLQVQFPSLLKLPGFLMEFITPIVKVWKGDPKNPRAHHDFFTMPQYEAWRQEPSHQKGWDHKYFKGLGTSDTRDAQVYFADLDKHLKQFHAIQDGEAELIDLAFSKKKADARKTWLGNFVPGTYLDMSGTAEITYDDFINKELILFSMADNLRSIPSVIDGLKPGQRKVMYTCFRRNLKKDVKVVELAGSVSGLTAYPYGETSLQQTIIGLAQNFVGSNNMNILEPSGNFGSRLQGGSDAASPRYIYTRLSSLARRIFHPADEPLLKYNTDDGKTIEPEMYVPVVPMVLINGADGIGTGWSTSVPNYRPEDVIENLKRRMEGDSKDSMTVMKPWYRGWTGETEQLSDERFKFGSTINATGDNEVEITELPVRYWTQEFKEKLEDILKAEKVPSFIKDYTEYNTPEKVHFIIKLEEKEFKKHQDKFEEAFKLSKTQATTNLVAFDEHGRIHKYGTPMDMLEEFYHVRLRMYQLRRLHMLNEMERDLQKLNNQARFVKMIIDNELTVSKKKKTVLVAELQKKGFTRFPKVIDARKEGEFEPVVPAEDEDDDSEDAEAAAGASDYDYLLGMAIWSLTQERVEKLLRQIGDKEDEITVLTGKSPKDLWKTDLDALLEEWNAMLDEESKREKKIRSKGRRASAKLGIGGKPGKKRKANDSDAFSDDDFAPKKPKTTAKSKGAAGLLALKADSKPAGVYPVVDGVEQERQPKPASKQTTLDAFKSASSSGKDPVDVDDKKPAAVKKPGRAKKVIEDEDDDDAEPAPAKKAGRPKKFTPIDDDDDEEDVFAAVAKEAPKPSAAPVRGARAAAQKMSYRVNSDDEDESSDADMLDEIPVPKGIGGSSNDESTRLFHKSGSRPSSSHGLKQKSSRGTLFKDEASVSGDESNWAALAQSSPQKTGRAAMPLGDDDSMDIDEPKPAPKPAKTAASKLKVKESTTLKPKKASAPAAAPPAYKPLSLSPAAKLVAKRKASGTNEAKSGASVPAKKAEAVKAKKADDDLVDEILDDDDDEDDSSPVKPAILPSRRAAAAAPKSKYTGDDEEDEEEDDDLEESAEFDNDMDETF
ncbi:hypothetical protein M409DRAFT_51799 [Zasmidium cellare ATCC 36951]|uniref:DNA topoisomerase 2 n=1 Tax=Zasmidium cellare ATCC 36951 TaxID=1080233 RepID=A0A6A6CRX4_ZASCE|nr:uncharacterized protein M409DRAFT_51799 [Zasmidium cellare ATCC 36951]KAF2170027.1 hypothetical protein M409DRAFT_51799 [Zasmidium cellare ATCC 36951]